MASESSTRMWRVCKDAGRPWPIICPEDDVLDYMVMEAVHLKVQDEEAKARKEAERKHQVEETRKALAKQFS